MRACILTDLLTYSRTCVITYTHTYILTHVHDYLHKVRLLGWLGLGLLRNWVLQFVSCPDRYHVGSRGQIIPVSANKNTPPENDPHLNLSFQSTKSGAGEQFLLPD